MSWQNEFDLVLSMCGGGANNTGFLLFLEKLHLLLVRSVLSKEVDK